MVSVRCITFEEAQKRDLEIGNVLPDMDDMKRLLPYRYPRPKQNEQT